MRHSGTASASSRAFGGRLTRIAAATIRYCRQLLRPADRTAMMNDLLNSGFESGNVFAFEGNFCLQKAVYSKDCFVEVAASQGAWVLVVCWAAHVRESRVKGPSLKGYIKEERG